MSHVERLTSYSHGGGCACKLATHELAEVLGHVHTAVGDTSVLVGLDTPDDAGVYRISADTAIVQTVDFFTPVVDDAYDWGRIAAANAISDIYAMGGRPATALNLVAWPRDLDFEVLGAVLEGGGAVCDEAGVTVLGGHSVDDPEPKFGLAVTGLIDPNEVVRNVGSAESDLVLTKPLGLGIISSAIKAGEASGASIENAVKVMTTLNREASAVMLEVGVDGATDVTGFGLIGHLAEMLGDRLSAKLQFESMPILPDALELAERGIVSGGSKANAKNLGDMVDSPDLTGPERMMLFDAQTSGGLLMAVPSIKTDGLLSRLWQEGVTEATRIGSLIPGHGSVTVERR
jgi:selenide,water dikinase